MLAGAGTRDGATRRSLPCVWRRPRGRHGGRRRHRRDPLRYRDVCDAYGSGGERDRDRWCHGPGESSGLLRAPSRPPRPISRWRAGAACSSSPGRGATFASIVRASLPTFQVPPCRAQLPRRPRTRACPTAWLPPAAVHVAVVEVVIWSNGARPHPSLRRRPRLRPRDQSHARARGKIHGGVTQDRRRAGRGDCYDAAAQFLTGSLTDAAAPVPTSSRSSRRVLEIASPRNPLGVKGVGQACDSRGPALANVIEDSSAPFGSAHH